ncbi:hypothetical protein BOTBODRAFT_49836 [Botryobasidium botryosum FD-172 SS1]|uniref:Uncharacterized protein n=1 Tax=Botryobasidium botryosum (strain FD-172 SS1) TaxID=930990 RepID=A0A067M1J8_BOTB1|nr:hypothetical protein BOTBODRAFT_49836 [Botryobasidium botryosum FD-172 SS1]
MREKVECDNERGGTWRREILRWRGQEWAGKMRECKDEQERGRECKDARTSEREHENARKGEGEHGEARMGEEYLGTADSDGRGFREDAALGKGGCKGARTSERDREHGEGACENK